MTAESILVVDDEEDILELVRYNLSKEGFAVTTVASGEQGLAAARAHRPALVILDLMLPGVDGLAVCQELKSDSQTADIPIVMLTAKGDESDIVRGLDLGAEDYILKPFSPRVLLARVKTVLRRQRLSVSDPHAPMTFGDLHIDPARHAVLVKSSSVDLTQSEFKILLHLALHRGLVFTRSQIVDAVHGEDYPVTDRSVDVQVVGLRKKLGHCGSYVETVRGVGYRFKE